MDAQDREADKRFFREEREKSRNIEFLQETCFKTEIMNHGGPPDEIVANVRKRVVDAVCIPLLDNPNVEVMSMPASLIEYNDQLHPILAKTHALKFDRVWIGNGPFTVYDAMSFEPKPATLEDVLVLMITPVLGWHFQLLLKEVSKLILYVPLSLEMENTGLIAKTRYSAFTAPY